MRKFKIAEVEFPAAYTVLTESLLDEHFGGIEKLDARLAETDIHGKAEELAKIAEALIAGGIQREKSRCKLVGSKYEGPEPVTSTVIAELMQPGELYDLFPAIKEAIKEGYDTKIKLEKPKGKNAKATLSE